MSRWSLNYRTVKASGWPRCPRKQFAGSAEGRREALGSVRLLRSRGHGFDQGDEKTDGPRKPRDFQASGGGVCGGEASRRLETMLGDVRGFSRASVFPGGFPKVVAGGGDIEDIIDDLEGQPEVPAGGAQSRDLTGFGTADEPAHHEGGFDHGGGFIQMDKIQFLAGCVSFFFCEEVGHLSTDESLATRGRREFADEAMGEVRLVGIRVGQQCKGVREQRVASEECGRFVKCLVGGGASAAQIIVIHAGQIIMNE